MADHQFFKFELEKKKKLYGQVQLSKLPDKGAKLKRDIDDLSQKIKSLELVSFETGEVGEHTCSDESIRHSGMEETSKTHKGIKSMPEKQTKSGNSDAEKRKIAKPERGMPVIFHSVEKPDVGNFVYGRCLANYEVPSIQGKSKPVAVSFEELKKNTDNKPFDPLPAKSLSFTTYRDQSVRPKTTKFTDAHYMNPSNSATFRKDAAQLGSFCPKGMNSAKQEAALNIHKGIRSCPAVQDEAEAPIKLKTSLMKHQKLALAWLLWRESQDPQGGIFADDMGLGKTLSLISLILKDHEQGFNNLGTGFGGTLIICPASILHQWHNEVEKHCVQGTLKVLVYHGAKREKSAKEIMDYDIVITTFNLIMSEGKAIQEKNRSSSLFELQWNRIVLDEAHTIKNHKSLTASWIFKLRSVKRWAVTGTPIHNDLKDLYCLLKFLQCKPFDDYNVWKKLINDFSDRSVDRRNALVKSILLRRCKNDLDENGMPLIPLPEKTSKVYQLKLSEEEDRIYKGIYRESKEILASKGNTLKTPNKNISRSNESLSRGSGGMYLTFLQKLQQCCCHLSLLKGPIEEEVSAMDLEMELNFSSLNISDKKSTESSSPIQDVSLSFLKQDLKYDPSYSSSKVSALMSLLNKILSRPEVSEKCVIVSQWVSMLNIIGVHLETAGIRFNVIKGATKPEDRITIAEDFNYNKKGPSVLLLSLKAGGVGLNLVGGNHIFLMDFHWNPALENQACDRIHRVGQIRKVYIHRFVCVGTIEEEIMNLQDEKMRLAGNVLNGAKAVRRNLTFEDIQRIFEL